MSVCAQGCMIRHKRYLIGWSSRFHFVFGPFASVLVDYNVQSSRLVSHIIPTQTILERLALLATERFSIKEKFALVAGGVDVNRCHLANPFWPIPVRKNMGDGQIWSPPRLIKVVSIFFETSKIKYPKVRAARRHTNFAKLFELLRSPITQRWIVDVKRC